MGTWIILILILLSLTREPFLFYEMRSTAKLMSEGISDDAIVKEIVEQNLFQYPTEKSITRMAKACIKRLHALEDDSLVSAIASQPTDVAKQICLYALMKQSRLVWVIYVDRHWREVQIKGHVLLVR